MLRKISINNYKMYDDFRLELSSGVNLICGSNGSGKSSLGEVLYALVGFLAMPDISDHVAFPVSEAFPFEVFCRWKMREKGSDDLTIKIEIDDEDDNEFTFGGGYFSYTIIIRYNFLDRLCRIQDERLHYISDGKPNEIISFTDGLIKMQTDKNKPLSFNGDWSMSGLIVGSRNNSRIRKFGKIVTRITTLHVLPSMMVQDFTSAPPVKKLGRWGENFPAWRFNCATEYPEKQNEALQECKSFIPGLISIADKAVGDLRRLAVRVNYQHEKYELSFGELSDGQKKLLTMYSLLANIRPHTTVLIDEPENYLAPSELQPWLDAMHEAWEESDIQFIIISHNPKTLNWYHKEAYILKIVGSPPRIDCHRHDGEKPLIEKLLETEWAES